MSTISIRKAPSEQARLRCNHAYTQEKEVIIFVTDDRLREMIHMKERDDDPSRLIIELVELFYIQHE